MNEYKFLEDGFVVTKVTTYNGITSISNIINVKDWIKHHHLWPSNKENWKNERRCCQCCQTDWSDSKSQYVWVCLFKDKPNMIICDSCANNENLKKYIVKRDL